MGTRHEPVGGLAMQHKQQYKKKKTVFRGLVLISSILRLIEMYVGVSWISFALLYQHVQISNANFFTSFRSHIM